MLFVATLFALTTQLQAEERPVAVKVKPVYPEIAKRLKITGSVLLNVIVEPDGTVKDVSTIMGHSALATAAKEAVRKWKFEPADHESTEQVEVEFH